MPQPPAYARSFSFGDDEASDPSGHVPGGSLDAEFNAIAVTSAAILANLVKIQRDDGALKNTVVTLDSLSADVLIALGGGGSWLPRGAWVTLTQYAVADVVQNGTATYVAAAVHVAAAVFADDYAAGKWIKLFDSAGVIPSDGSVTTPKIADGSVTEPKIGFTSLDLAGSIRGQGGLSAGTAPEGALMHAKTAAGAVLVKAERTTDAQGAVGYQIVGVGATWTLQQAAGSNNLQLLQGATIRLTFDETGYLVVAGAIRSTGADPAAGAGVHLSYIAGVGYLTSRDYTANAWKDLKLRGKDVYITAGGVDIAKATSTGMDILAGKTLTLDGSAVGYLGIPQNIDNDARTLSSADNGRHIYSENVAGQTITVPLNATDPLPVDYATLIINDGSNPISLTGEDATVLIRLAGTATVTQTRTIAAGGWAFVKKVKTNRWWAGGNGVS